MAVVKAAYAKGSSSGVVKYALHRDAEVERQGSLRKGFTSLLEGLNTSESVDVLKPYEETGKGYTYHIIMNPGDGNDALPDLQQWTRDSMRQLEQKHGREIPYVAVVHDDHSDHAHVHVIAHTEKTLRKDELNYVRNEATRLYERQRELYRDHTFEEELAAGFPASQIQVEVKPPVDAEAKDEQVSNKGSKSGGQEREAAQEEGPKLRKRIQRDMELG